MVDHPSGLEDEGEIGFVSMEFWNTYHGRLDPGWSQSTEAFNSLLYFQQGWKACKDFYKINE